MIAILSLAGVAGLLLLSVALAALNVSRAKRTRKPRCVIRHAPDNLHYRPFISTEESN